MVGLSIPQKQAHDDVAAIFHIRDKRNGKDVMRCSRCETVNEKGRGKNFVVNLNCITKAKEHIVVYCPEIRPEVNSADAKLRHTLLISMSDKQVESLSAYGKSLREYTYALYRCVTFCI